MDENLPQQSSSPTDQELSSLPELMTRSQLAKILKISVHTLSMRQKELEHVLPVVKLNSRVIRYKLSDVQKLIEQGGI